MKHFSVLKCLFLLALMKETLKAQKLWSNWAALSSKLSHDNDITVDSHRSHSMQHFLRSYHNYTCFANRCVSQLHLNAMEKAQQAPKNSDKEILHHVLICDRGRTSLNCTRGITEFKWNCKNSLRLFKRRRKHCDLKVWKREKLQLADGNVKTMCPRSIRRS